MNAEKFTQKTIETINTAQAMAQENGNQYLTPAHLLYALIDQDGGLIGSLLTKMGADCDAMLGELDAEIAKLPRVSGGSGETYASPETSKLLRFAEKAAEKLGDEYISVEHLMLGMFSEGGPAVRKILSDHGVTREAFNTALAKVKTGPVTSDNPEDSYDALTKYGTGRCLSQPVCSMKASSMPGTTMLSLSAYQFRRPSHPTDICEKTKEPIGISGCIAPEVPIRRILSERLVSRISLVRKSMFARASSSFITMSILSVPIPVDRTVILFPRYFPVTETNSRD